MGRDAFRVQRASLHGNTATWRNGEFPVPVGLVIRLKHRGARVVPMGVFVALGVLVAGGHQVGGNRRGVHRQMR